MKNPKEIHSDLIYFGLDGEDEEQRFIRELLEAFPEAVLSDAYEEYKGNRQEVAIDVTQLDAFNAWLIAFGWDGSSLYLQIKMRESSASILYVSRVLDKAKTLYPERFKTCDEKRDA